MDNKIDCECFPYRSIVKGKIEKGVSITLFDILESEFKENVWDPLRESIDISCAFVDSPAYRGCSTNWPGVFAESNCP